jgi:hypothetical protein
LTARVVIEIEFKVVGGSINNDKFLMAQTEQVPTIIKKNDKIFVMSDAIDWNCYYNRFPKCSMAFNPSTAYDNGPNYEKEQP